MKLLLCLITSFFFTITHSQEPYPNKTYTIKYTDINELNKTEILQCFKVESHYILITKRAIVGPGGWFYSVEKYDRAFNPIYRYNISDFANKKSLAIDNHVILGKKMMLVFAQLIGEEKDEQLVYTFFDFQTGEMSQTFPFKDSFKPSNYLLKKSPDENILMIVHWELLKEENKINANFLIVDQNFEEIIQYPNYKLELDGELDRISNFEIDNEARIYWLKIACSAKNFQEYLTEYPKEIKQTVEINQLEYSILTTKNIDITDKQITNIGLKIKDNNEVYAAGYYSDSELDTINGVFVYSGLFVENAKPKLNINSFDQNLVLPPNRELTSQENRKYKNLSINDLSLVDVIPFQNGDVTLIGEMEKVVLNAGGSVYSSYFGDYIISNFLSNGSITHTKYYNYQSMSPSSAYCFHFNLKDKLTFIKDKSALDLIVPGQKELSKKDMKELKKRHSIYLTQMNKDGSFIEYKLIDYNDTDFYNVKRESWLTKTSFFLEEQQELILFFEFKDKRHGLVSIRFK